MKSEYSCKHGCGKVLKTRAGIYKHEVKCNYQIGVSNEEILTEVSPTENLPESHTDEVSIEDENSSTPTESPSFTKFTFDNEEIENNIPIPTPLKFITKGDKKSKGKKSKADIATMNKTNLAMLKMGYKSVDTLASKYRVAITGDETKTISHSESNYDWISGITNSYLMEIGFDINSYIGTGKAAIICNGYWFGSMGATIHSDAKRLDKSLGLIRVPLKGIKKVFSYIPIIGKRFKPKEISDFGQDADF